MPDDVTMIVGSSGLYHRSDCHHIGRIWSRNLKNYTALEAASFRAALDGRSPCQSCNPPHNPDWDNLGRHLPFIRRMENMDVAVMRRAAVTMLDGIFGRDGENRTLKSRVLDLNRRGKIPTDVANCLHMIGDFRNMAEHEGELTDLQAVIARLCWLLVTEWSAGQIAQGPQINNGGI